MPTRVCEAKNNILRQRSTHITHNGKCSPQPCGPFTSWLLQCCVMCAKRDSVSSFTSFVWFAYYSSSSCPAYVLSVVRPIDDLRFLCVSNKKKKTLTCNVCTIFADWSIGWTSIEHRVRLAFMPRRMSSLASHLCVKLFIVCCVGIIFHRTRGACSLFHMADLLDQGLENIFI